MKLFLRCFTIILLALALFVIMPFALLWSINTLFCTHLAYSFTTWLAIVILYSCLIGNKTVSIKDTKRNNEDV